MGINTSIQEQFIGAQVAQSVQVVPDALKNQNLLRFDTVGRGPLLPSIGTRERERALFKLYWHDYNGMYRSGISALTKKMQSTPYEIKGTPEQTLYFQAMLANADLGNGWAAFLSKAIIDYSRQDAGAYIEIIGRGNVDGQLVGAVTGLSVLDSRRCLPTGDPEYPVIYMDALGAMHTMHFSRVTRLVDMNDSNEVSQYYGDCSLSRAVAPVWREILMGRYIEVQLDDKPPPGILLLGNISDPKIQAAVKRMHDENRTDVPGEWGRTLKLYGLEKERAPTAEFVQFATAPEKFDFEKYKTLSAREIASAIGIDVQEIWELTGGGNIGTATQSEVLHQKSKGKGLGRLLKALERLLNQVFPRDMEFRFAYQDIEDDQQRATLAQTWAGTITILERYLTTDEIRQLTANQIEAVNDVITDQDGAVVRVNDSDPKAPEQLQPLEAPPEVAAMPALPAPEEEEEVIIEGKSLVTTQVAFMDVFNRALQLAKSGQISKRALSASLRVDVVSQGRKAYIDGLNEVGAEGVIDDAGERIISKWRSEQLPFVDKFVDSLFSGDFSNAQLQTKAQQWTNKSINPLYYAGLDVGAPEQRWLWIMNPTKEHCKTCLRLNGQIHRMKEYTDRGLLPQSTNLDCHGDNCGCRLEKVNAPSRGRFSGLGARIIAALRPGATGG